ncbi:MAG: SUMF1/EgtB/PvdO family nonheme iron enzyme, partial [Caldilinea sp.]
PATGEHRVLRGGSWNFFDLVVRSAARSSSSPDFWSDDLFGFRCVRSQ